MSYNYTFSEIMSNPNSLFPLPVSSSSTFSLHIFTRNDSWKTITNEYKYKTYIIFCRLKKPENFVKKYGEH